MEKINGIESERARNWTAIIYESELEDDWLAKLEKLCVPACVSPLHTPEGKKAHRHILISGDKKSEKQIKSVLAELSEYVEIDGKEQIKGIANPQKVVNLKSTVRYFLHLDNPSKQQFEEKKLLDFGGFDSAKYLISETEKKKVEFASIKTVIRIIKDKKVNHIIDLLDYLSEVDDELFTVCCQNAYLCTQLVSKFKKELKSTKSGLNIVNEAMS